MTSIEQSKSYFKEVLVYHFNSQFQVFQHILQFENVLSMAFPTKGLKLLRTIPLYRKEKKTLQFQVLTKASPDENKLALFSPECNNPRTLDIFTLNPVQNPLFPETILTIAPSPLYFSLSSSLYIIFHCYFKTSIFISLSKVRGTTDNPFYTDGEKEGGGG